MDAGVAAGIHAKNQSQPGYRNEYSHTISPYVFAPANPFAFSEYSTYKGDALTPSKNSPASGDGLNTAITKYSHRGGQKNDTAASHDVNIFNHFVRPYTDHQNHAGAPMPPWNANHHAESRNQTGIDLSHLSLSQSSKQGIQAVSNDFSYPKMSSSHPVADHGYYVLSSDGQQNADDKFYAAKCCPAKCGPSKHCRCYESGMEDVVSNLAGSLDTALVSLRFQAEVYAVEVGSILRIIDLLPERPSRIIPANTTIRPLNHPERLLRSTRQIGNALEMTRRVIEDLKTSQSKAAKRFEDIACRRR